MNKVEQGVFEALQQLNRERSADHIQEFITATVIGCGATSISELNDEVLAQALFELDDIQKRLRLNPPPKGSVLNVLA